MIHQAYFRFYAELNDLLAPAQKQTELNYQFRGNPAIKDAVENEGHHNVSGPPIAVYSKVHRNWVAKIRIGMVRRDKSGRRTLSLSY